MTKLQQLAQDLADLTRKHSGTGGAHILASKVTNPAHMINASEFRIVGNDGTVYEVTIMEA